MTSQSTISPGSPMASPLEDQTSGSTSRYTSWAKRRLRRSSARHAASRWPRWKSQDMESGPASSACRLYPRRERPTTCGSREWRWWLRFPDTHIAGSESVLCHAAAARGFRSRSALALPLLAPINAAGTAHSSPRPPSCIDRLHLRSPHPPDLGRRYRPSGFRPLARLIEADATAGAEKPKLAAPVGSREIRNESENGCSCSIGTER